MYGPLRRGRGDRGAVSLFRRGGPRDPGCARRIRPISAEMKVNYRFVRSGGGEELQTGRLVLLCVAAWAIPGAGHLWLGWRTKGLIFLGAIPLMFAIGL